MRRICLLAAVFFCCASALLSCDVLSFIDGYETETDCFHEYVWHEGVEPTPTEKGRTPYEFCSLCGDIRVDYHEIDYA